MNKKIKRILQGAIIFLVVFIAVAVYYLNTLMPIITGYTAKNLCSDVFVSGRKQSDVESIDLNFSFIKFTKNTVDYTEKSVTSRFLWGKSKAVYREGFGVTLLKDITEADLFKSVFPEGGKPSYSQDTIKWPLGDIMISRNTGIDTNKLAVVSHKLITDNGYGGNAFAFVVVHKGAIVEEAYKPQFTSKTRFLSWSMAKSFINALTGILVYDGKLDIMQPAGLDEWNGDGRKMITFNDLMQMQSGLKWNEDYGNRSDVTLMLHCTGDMAHYSFDRPLAYHPGTHWYYSSGSTNIVSYLIRKQFKNDSSYYIFARNRLFNKIGAPDAVFEVDPAGTFIGSSYLYATARDYARFGLLYLNEGVINGERLFPSAWVKYTTTVASANNGSYGAFFWLNRNKRLPSAPTDLFSCEGHDGQHIYILPSQKMVIVILGFSPSSKGGTDTDRLLRDILDTVNR